MKKTNTANIDDKQETEVEKEKRLKKMRVDLIANRPNLEPPKPRSAKPNDRCIR